MHQELWTAPWRSQAREKREGVQFGNKIQGLIFVIYFSWQIEIGNPKGPKEKAAYGSDAKTSSVYNMAWTQQLSSLNLFSSQGKILIFNANNSINIFVSFINNFLLKLRIFQFYWAKRLFTEEFMQYYISKGLNCNII